MTGVSHTSSPVLVGGVEHAAQWAVAEARQREGDLAERFAGGRVGEVEGLLYAGGGIAQLAYDLADAHLAGVVLVGGAKRLDQTDGLCLGEGAREHRAGDGVQQALAHLWGAEAGEGVQPCLPAWLQAQGDAAERVDEWLVLALGVDDLAAAPEHAGAVQPALGQRALAEVGLAEHDRVRDRQHPRPVQQPRVVHERAAVQVAADVHAARAQPGLRNGGVGGLEVCGGDLVPGALSRARQARQLPRRALGERAPQ